jgi:hypothetical protein
MTFELTVLSKRDRHDNDCYRAMPVTDYLAECFKRACRVAAKRRVNQKYKSTVFPTKHRAFLVNDNVYRFRQAGGGALF